MPLKLGKQQAHKSHYLTSVTFRSLSAVDRWQLPERVAELSSTPGVLALERRKSFVFPSNPSIDDATSEPPREPLRIE